VGPVASFDTVKPLKDLAAEVLTLKSSLVHIHCALRLPRTVLIGFFIALHASACLAITLLEDGLRELRPWLHGKWMARTGTRAPRP
jgi:hypothetical protein